MQVAATPICVVVISLGRPDCLRSIAGHLGQQTRKPDQILFVVTSPEDAPSDLTTLDLTVTTRVIIARKGTCHQRNVGLDNLAHSTGIVVFLDDDYVPSPDALEAIEAAFSHFGSEVAGMSGHLIADGIRGTGITAEDAERMIKSHKNNQKSDFLTAPHFSVLKDTVGLYGCNMALRIEDVGSIRFDEALPLYAWQEDVDFGNRIARSTGKRMVLTDAFSGVHRGVKGGREKRGIRLGYSQLANTWYLRKNNGLPARFAWRTATRNVLANHLRMFWSEPWIDRRGRAIGNWLALIDILTRRVDPQRIHRL